LRRSYIKGCLDNDYKAKPYKRKRFLTLNKYLVHYFSPIKWHTSKIFLHRYAHEEVKKFTSLT
ncbi:MAG: hypothetical protein QXF93_03620, partial [Saccharolobus sp.]